MKVLIISAHPDDIEINCAGTAIKMVERGDDVTICSLCNGNLGHMVIKPKELAEIRANEAKRSAEILGVNYIPPIRGDLILYHQDKETRDAVVDIIRVTNPEMIITHHPNDYMSDHVAVSHLVFDASFCASLPHYESAENTVVPICPIFYMDNLGTFDFEPTEYVDITNEFEHKIQALNCHKSQLKWMLEHDGIDFTETVATFTRMRGLQAGVKYAEGFIQMKGWGRMVTRRLLP